MKNTKFNNSNIVLLKINPNINDIKKIITVSLAPFLGISIYFDLQCLQIKLLQSELIFILSKHTLHFIYLFFILNYLLQQLLTSSHFS